MVASTRLRESQVFRGGETKRQDSGTEVEDTLITRNEGNETLGIRTDPGLAALVSEPGEVKRSATGGSGHRRENVHGQSCSVGAAESRARDNVKRDIAGRRQRRHLHGEVTYRIQDSACRRSGFLAVGWKCGPAQTGRALVETTTRKGKGSTDKDQRNSKDTETEKGEREEGYCGHWKWRHRQKGCLLVETRVQSGN